MREQQQRRIINRLAWTLGALSVAVLMAATIVIGNTDTAVDHHLVAALLVSGVIADWLPIRWVRKGETWVVHSAGTAWTATGLALLAGPLFVIVAGASRAAKMWLKGRFGDGVSRADNDGPRIWVNIALVVLPSAVAALAVASVDTPLAAGLIGAAIYSIVSTTSITAVVNLTRGSALTDGLWDALRTRSTDVAGEMAAAIVIILAVQAMGPWLPLLTLSGVVVAMWRQAVRLHTQTTLNSALLDMTAAVTDAESKADLFESVDRASQSIFGRPAQLRRTTGRGDPQEEDVAAVVPVPGDQGLELAIGHGTYHWPFRIGPFEEKALRALGGAAAMGWTAVEAREQLREQAVRDPLSGLLNRRGFEEYAGRVHERMLSGGRDSTLAYVDLDDFKRINDSMGHDAGDAVIVAVGAALAEHLRPSDVAGRLGGDEFAVIFADELDERTARARIRTALSQLPHGVNSSVGVARSNSKSFDELIAKADKAMYAEKMARRSEPTSAGR